MTEQRMCNCVRQYAREDATNDHNGRALVPTVWGQKRGNTKWVGNWEDFRAAGGMLCFNGDQTEITLHLPAGFKFGIRFADGLDVSKLDKVG